MPKSRIIPVIGFFIALLPILGFPHSWESFFQLAGGLSIVLLSVLISIDKRLTQKVKAERRLMAKRSRMEREIDNQAELQVSENQGNSSNDRVSS